MRLYCISFLKELFQRYLAKRCFAKHVFLFCFFFRLFLLFIATTHTDNTTLHDYLNCATITTLHYTAKPTYGNRPFARSGHMAQNKLHWDANYAVGLSKQRKVRLDWYEFLCFGSPTA